MVEMLEPRSPTILQTRFGNRTKTHFEAVAANTAGRVVVASGQLFATFTSVTCFDTQKVSQQARPRSKSFVLSSFHGTRWPSVVLLTLRNVPGSDWSGVREYQQSHDQRLPGKEARPDQLDLFVWTIVSDQSACGLFLSRTNKPNIHGCDR